MHVCKLWIDRFLAFVCIVLCGSLTIIVTWQVVGRFVFSAAGAQSEELAKIMFVWLVLLGAALLFGEKGHMSIEILVDYFSSRWKTIFQIITSVLILLFVASILLIGGFDAVQRTMRQTNAAIPYISTGQIYIALPLCGAFSIFYCIYNIWTDIKVLVKSKAENTPSRED
ncbi:TRAP transporter small permease [Cohaesibacter celericrescens]|uniref:TRAP transporter small permease n=1 Tax=Cohaesibacter celericrescens TaxID=2067669 RepID=UPI0035650330